jgi:hypothetical protein
LRRSEASPVIETRISSIPDRRIEKEEQLLPFDRAADVIAENSQEGIETSKRRANLR